MNNLTLMKRWDQYVPTIHLWRKKIEHISFSALKSHRKHLNYVESLVHWYLACGQSLVLASVEHSIISTGVQQRQRKCYIRVRCIWHKHKKKGKAYSNYWTKVAHNKSRTSPHTLKWWTNDAPGTRQGGKHNRKSIILT